MKGIILFLSVLRLGLPLSFAQGAQEINQLLRVLETKGDSIALVDTLNERAYQLRHTDPPKSSSYAEQAYRLATYLHYAGGRASSLIRSGILAKNEEEYEEAEKHYLMALKIRKQLGSKEEIASCFNNLGIIKKNQEDYKIAIKYYQEGLDLLERASFSRLKGKLHNNLGSTLRYVGEYELAQKHLEQSLIIRDELDDTLGMANTFLNLGFLNQNLGEYQLSEDYAFQSIKLFEIRNNNVGMAKCYKPARE